METVSKLAVIDAPSLGGLWFVWNKMTVTQSCFFDDALCIVSNVTGINEKTKGMFKFIA